MNAAQTVSTGDLHVKVPVHQSEGDLAQLGETFNKMTEELRSQRDELVNASELIDSRRRFIEAVLSSASAGIIGVDTSGSVGILNRSAEKLIGHSEAETLGHPLSDVLPELEEMMKTAREGTQRLVQGRSRSRATGRNAICRSASAPRRPASRTTATSSRSTTSPNWSRRNAPRPGATSRAASRMRSRIR
ncbi:PAS domain-containing protein [Bradyrhizobium lupini]|uniref:PAS domain-containing protein n=1 Tax=Rhizobium lupini TaxID=136996 RepID=UPI0034C5C61E